MSSIKWWPLYRDLNALIESAFLKYPYPVLAIWCIEMIFVYHVNHAE